MRRLVPLFFCGLLMPALITARTINVCSTCAEKDLQHAVDVAKPGDTLLIKAGNYSCVNLQINKPLTIIGVDHPVLNGYEKNEVLVITANHVTLQGLDICNSKMGSMKDYAGIRVFKCTDVVIDNCRLTNTFFGIYLSDSKRITVRKTHSKGANYGKSDTGNGIHLWKCDTALIEDNLMEGHRDGIYLEFTRNSLIQRNTSENNFRYGLHFMFSDNDTYKQNRFDKNGTGVAVMYSKGVHMFNNRFENNWGDASYGLLLKDMDNGIIKNNVFKNNTVGITMEGSNHMHVEGNDFYSNGYALKVMANCISDTFIRNNFSGNTFDASTNGELQDNIFTGNYWDKYEGYDLNKDGFGDVPFYPVSLYAVIVERMPYAVMLLHSFTIDLLNRAERSIPDLIPATFVDGKPLMKIIKR